MKQSHQFFFAIALVLSTLAGVAHAGDKVNAEHRITCSDGTEQGLKVSFLVQRGEFALPGGGMLFQKVSLVTGADGSTSVCSGTKSAINSIVLHCSVTQNKVRYEVYPRLNGDAVQSADVVAWTGKGTTHQTLMNCSGQ